MIETGLAGRVVIVTGAAAGIGRATARRFAEEGARVVAWDVSGEAANGLLGEIEAAGGEGHFSVVDVSDSEAVASAVAEAVERWERIDVLINNAGILRDAQLVKYKNGEVVSTMSDADFDAVIGVNLRGVFICTRAVVPEMIRGGRGVVLSASSVVGHHGNFGQTNYAATKAGVINMTQSWARELGRHNIRVNAVAPGFVSTEILRTMPQKALDGMLAHTPLRRIGKPEEIAEVYVWLASDAASYVHGTVISADGGLVVGT
jgi:3-oxoacyl-[acyl-carrier protein] reductase